MVYNKIRGEEMKEFILFIQDIFMLNHRTDKMIGLSQFKDGVTDPISETEVSLKTKNVKLSDLMRRAS